MLHSTGGSKAARLIITIITAASGLHLGDHRDRAPLRQAANLPWPAHQGRVGVPRRTNDRREVLELDQRDVGAGQLLWQRPQRVCQQRAPVVDRLGLLPLRARVRGLQRPPRSAPAPGGAGRRLKSATLRTGASTTGLAGCLQSGVPRLHPDKNTGSPCVPAPDRGAEAGAPPVTKVAACARLNATRHATPYTPRSRPGSPA